MTHITLTLNNYLLNPLSELVYFILNKISQANEARERYMSARVTFNELQQLSDRDLLDMGICRGDIYDIAYHNMSVSRYRIN